jgi:hypothetical protein
MANGRREKFDKRLTVRIDNRHNIEVTRILDGSGAVWADAVRASMIQLERDVQEDESIVRQTLDKVREEGFISGETVKRDVLVSETFRLYFSRLALNAGYDLSEYIVASIQIYLPTFASNPWYAVNVYVRWERRNGPKSDASKNDAQNQMMLSMRHGSKKNEASGT